MRKDLSSPELIETHLIQMDLPLYSVGGISHPHTIKFQGTIHSFPVILMVDIGTSHCFVSQKLEQTLGLSTLETATFGVHKGDGRFHWVVPTLF